MYGRSKISLIMPVLNEAEGLPFVLKSIPDFIDEIIVVDNGSTDESVSIARRFGARVIQETRRGYGRAIISGLIVAEGDIVAVSDADCTYPVGYLYDVVLFLCRGNFDFVSGCRFPLKNKGAMPILNVVGNYLVSWMVRALFKISIYDLESGFMVFHKRYLERIKLSTTGMEFSQEIKIKAWLSVMKCAEIHIPYYARVGKVKFRKIKDGLRDVWGLAELMRECSFTVKNI